MSKYDALALKCFGKEYDLLALDEQIIIVDLYEEKED